MITQRLARVLVALETINAQADAEALKAAEAEAQIEEAAQQAERMNETAVTVAERLIESSERKLQDTIADLAQTVSTVSGVASGAAEAAKKSGSNQQVFAGPYSLKAPEVTIGSKSPPSGMLTYAKDSYVRISAVGGGMGILRGKGHLDLAADLASLKCGTGDWYATSEMNLHSARTVSVFTGGPACRGQHRTQLGDLRHDQDVLRRPRCWAEHHHGTNRADDRIHGMVHQTFGNGNHADRGREQHRHQSASRYDQRTDDQLECHAREPEPDPAAGNQRRGNHQTHPSHERNRIVMPGGC